MNNTALKNLCRTAKHTNDSLYGLVPLSNFAVNIIDTLQFQRLRKIKQLGSCDYIYHNAVHTRFEHSIGTYCLSSRLTQRICYTTDPADMNEYLRKIPELHGYIKDNYDTSCAIFDPVVQELVNVAALCHDLGHGPFSHVFDDNICKQNKTPNASHEMRSTLILEKIIKESDLLSSLLTDDLVKFINSLILPNKQKQGFIYQIISNNLNYLDVDKFDYITRDSYILGIKSNFDYRKLLEQALVIDNIICYPEQILFDIYCLFQMRHHLHKLVYSHKGVIAAQLMINELVHELKPVIDFEKSIHDLDLFCNLNDAYIFEFFKVFKNLTKDPITLEKVNVEKIECLINRLNKHDLYTYIGGFSCDKKKKINFELFCKKYNANINNLVIHESKIGYVSGNKDNPLDNIYVYKTKDVSDKCSLKARLTKKTDITHIIPQIYQEHIGMLFYKGDEYTKDELTQLKHSFFEFIDIEYSTKYVFNE